MKRPRDEYISQLSPASFSFILLNLPSSSFILLHPPFIHTKTYEYVRERATRPVPPFASAASARAAAAESRRDAAESLTIRLMSLNKSLLDHYQRALAGRDERRATQAMAALERAGINTAATVAAAALTGWDGEDRPRGFSRSGEYFFLFGGGGGLLRPRWGQSSLSFQQPHSRCFFGFFF